MLLTVGRDHHPNTEEYLLYTDYGKWIFQYMPECKTRTSVLFLTLHSFFMKKSQWRRFSPRGWVSTRSATRHNILWQCVHCLNDA